MKKYTILPTEPVHHLMYDQGMLIWNNLILNGNKSPKIEYST